MLGTLGMHTRIWCASPSHLDHVQEDLLCCCHITAALCDTLLDLSCPLALLEGGGHGSLPSSRLLLCRGPLRPAGDILNVWSKLNMYVCVWWGTGLGRHH